MVIAQRLHEHDIPGHCIETGLFQHINLPAIAQRDELIALGGSRTKARKVGDVLFERASRARPWNEYALSRVPPTSARNISKTPRLWIAA